MLPGHSGDRSSAEQEHKGPQAAPTRQWRVQGEGGAGVPVFHTSCPRTSDRGPGEAQL